MSENFFIEICSKSVARYLTIFFYSFIFRIINSYTLTTYIGCPILIYKYVPFYSSNLLTMKSINNFEENCIYRLKWDTLVCVRVNNLVRLVQSSTKRHRLPIVDVQFHQIPRQGQRSVLDPNDSGAIHQAERDRFRIRR